MHPTRAGVQCWMARLEQEESGQGRNRSTTSITWSISSIASVWEDLGRHSSVLSFRQHNGSDLYQSERGHFLQLAVPTSNHTLELVYREEYLTNGRTLAGSPQCNSRPGVMYGPRSLRLDAQSEHISENLGPPGNGPVCLAPDQATSSLLQLESRPRSHSDRRFLAGLVPTTRVCQSTMVLDSLLSLQSISTGSINHSLLEDPIMVSNTTGTPGWLPSNSTSTARSGGDANRSGVPNETGSSPTDCLAYLWQSYSLQGFSSEASSLMLASWRDKTNSNYGSSFAKWASWCHQQGKNPLLGPIADVINFLADLCAQGYQYQSLNCYRSAISSVHEAVDGVSVGTHPAVTVQDSWGVLFTWNHPCLDIHHSGM